MPDQVRASWKYEQLRDMLHCFPFVIKARELCAERSVTAVTARAPSLLPPGMEQAKAELQLSRNNSQGTVQSRVSETLVARLESRVRVDPILTTQHAKPDWTQCSLEAKDGEVWKGGARPTVPIHTGTWTGASCRSKPLVSTHHIPEGLAPSTSNDKQARINQPAGIADISLRFRCGRLSSMDAPGNTAASRGAAMPFSQHAAAARPGSGFMQPNERQPHRFSRRNPRRIGSVVRDAVHPDTRNATLRLDYHRTHPCRCF